ncbi:MAG: 4Fe-4S dicluster domain-containing protein [Planctomycetota bacterium]|nr:MAG: 4Fe-4S dicluster domain-containing protein [Planctomycetota bacterium]
MLTNLIIISGVLLVVAVVAATLLAFRREDRTRVALEEARAAGLDRPASLHPVIDNDACIGSGACLKACPESVLGRAGGKTHLVHATDCIGHGRCQAACPVEAITLVFGTAERGVDIPLLRAGYETNVDGILIAGELGGMGLIRNAMTQGLKAVETIPRILERPGVAEPDEEVPDVCIVGGGPAGIAAALACSEKKLRYVLLEQWSLGGSVTHYPRRKLVFTERITLPIVGPFGKPEMLKEELVAEFERILLQADITLLEGRRVTGVSGRAGDFRIAVDTAEGPEEYRARTVLLAIGRRGTPRRLEVPGADLPHVVYRLLDPEQYRHRKVLCVGGGDSSVEAALSLSRVAGCEVHLSYRGEALFRCRKKNRDAFAERVAEGKIRPHFGTNVARIAPDQVVLRHDDGREETLAIDDVVVNIGGLLPTPFLESMGIAVETKFGEAAGPPPSAPGAA